MNIRDGLAVVTGASSGIGEALALRLAGRGTAVGLLARRGTLLEALADRIRKEGGKALAVPCDVAHAGEVIAAVAEVKLRFGAPDLVVANAAIGYGNETGRWDPERSLRVYRVNVLGALNAIFACLPDMVEAGRGRVCGIASLAAWQGLPGFGDYCGSKAALRIHLEALRAELRPKGVRVTTVCPGYVRTPLTDGVDFDMPFLMEVDEAARRILRAIDRGKREVLFPWPMALAVRLGRLVPRALYDRVVRPRSRPPRRTQAKSDDRLEEV